MAADAQLIRAIRGPITLITLGVLFTFDHFTPYGFGQTWPVLLIVFGFLSLLRRGAMRQMEPPPWGGPPGTPPWGGPPGSPPWGGPPGTPPWAGNRTSGSSSSSGGTPTGSSSTSGSSSGGGYRKSSYGSTSGPPNAGNPTGGPQ